MLGRPVRPGDLPSDSEVREQVLILIRDAKDRPAGADGDVEAPARDQPEPAPGEELGRLADLVDRFAVYKLRLAPLEAVKQDPRRHPEGDALYHSLQVFELARRARPYDEEFLLAALLHDVGKGIDPSDPTGAALEALRGAVTDRTLALIGHLRAFRLAGEKPRRGAAGRRPPTPSTTSNCSARSTTWAGSPGPRWAASTRRSPTSGGWRRKTTSKVDGGRRGRREPGRRDQGSASPSGSVAAARAPISCAGSCR